MELKFVREALQLVRAKLAAKVKSNSYSEQQLRQAEMLKSLKTAFRLQTLRAALNSFKHLVYC